MKQETLDLDKNDFIRVKILDASNDLMQEIGFDRLKVKDICLRADISRQTFYHYFKDKYDIAQWYWNVLSKNGISQTGRTTNWYESNVDTLNKFAECYDFFKSALLSHDDYNSILQHGRRSRVALLKETITDFLGLELTDDLIFQIEFYVDAESRAIRDWVCNGMPTPPEHFARQLELCVPAQLYNLLELKVI